MGNQFTLDFSCVNCEAPIPWSRKRKVYCGNFCKEETSTIRWIRSTIIRGITDRPDVVDTRRLRLAWLNSGGYSTTGRQISNAIRAFIVKKYNKKWQTRLFSFDIRRRGEKRWCPPQRARSTHKKYRMRDRVR